MQIMSLMTALPGAAAQGLIWGIMAIGVYITFRILDIADLTVDGTLCRAIVNNPKLLLADEPTGALDTKSGAQVMELFQKLNDEGVSVLMITHDPEIAAHAKRVVMIRDGELQEKR